MMDALQFNTCLASVGQAMSACPRCHAYVAGHCATDEQQSRCELPPFVKRADVSAELAAAYERIAELETALHGTLPFIEQIERKWNETFPFADRARAALNDQVTS